MIWDKFIINHLKMASTFMKHVQRLANPILRQCPVIERASFHTTSRTLLFQDEILGMEGFFRQREVIQERVGSLRETFRNRMEEFMESSDKKHIFTDDLKMIAHLANTQEELLTATKMAIRYHERCLKLRFSSFHFGPVIMRMYHSNKRPDLALEAFNNPEFDGFFHQISSFVILMDMLYEAQMYEEVLHISDRVTEINLNGMRFPQDCLKITMAACLKLNTPDSFKKMVSILSQCNKAGIKLSSRVIVYSIMLCLKQNKPERAYEIVSLVNPQNKGSLALHNVKISVLLAGGETRNAVDLLMSQLVDKEDEPDTSSSRIPEIFTDVLEQVRAAVEKANDKEMSLDLKRIDKVLETQGQLLINQTLEDYIFMPVKRPRQYQDKYKQRQRSYVVFDNRRKKHYKNTRPGLNNEFISL